MLTINKAITRSLAAALALTLAWPPPASALKVQTSSESSGLEELSSALNPVAMSPTQRRQIERVLWDDHHRRTLKRGVVSEREWDALDARSLGHFHPPAPYEGTRQSNYSGLPWLQWQLGHPLLETEEIRARQEAVREILTARAPDHRPLGFTLREWIQGRWHGISPSSLPQDWSNPGPGWPNVWTVAHERWVRQEVLDALTGPIPSGPIRSLEDEVRRKKIRFIRDRVPKDLWRLGQGMQALAVLLSDAQSPRLRALRWVAQAASDAHHPYQLARLGQPRPLTVKEAAEILTHRHRSIALLLRAAREVDTHRVVAELASVGGDYERFSAWSSWRRSSRRAWKTFPAILSPVAGRPHLFIRHGQALRPLAEAGRSVPNSVRLGTQDPARPNPTVAVIVGPNTEGKSTYLRMAGLLVLLASVGSPVPAPAMAMTPLMVRIHSSLADDPKTARSLFRVQSDDLQDVDRAIHHNPLTLVLLDEMLPGTYPRGRQVLEQAILSRMADTGALIMLATHNLRLATLARQKLDWTTLRVTGYHVRPGMMTRQEADRAILRTLRQSGWPRPFVASVRRHLADGRTSSTRPGPSTRPAPGRDLLRTGLEEPPTLTRREFFRHLAAVVSMGRQIEILAEGLSPSVAAPTVPAWDRHRGDFQTAARDFIGTDVLWSAVRSTAERLASSPNEAVNDPKTLRHAADLHRLLAEAHRNGLAVQRQVTTPGGRKTLVQQLWAMWSPEMNKALLQDLADHPIGGVPLNEDGLQRVASRLERLGQRGRALADALAALPDEWLAEGLRWAMADRLRALQQPLGRLEAALVKTWGLDWAQRLPPPDAPAPATSTSEVSGLLRVVLDRMPAPVGDESLTVWSQRIHAPQGPGLVSPVEETARRLRTLLRDYHFAQQAALWAAFLRAIPSVTDDAYRTAWLTEILEHVATLHEMQGPPSAEPIQQALTLLRAAPAATGMEEPGQPPADEMSRREAFGRIAKTIATLSQLSTRLGTLAKALAPPPSSAAPAWDPYRGALPLAFDEIGLASGGNRGLIYGLMLEREAGKLGILTDPTTSAVRLADWLSATSFPEAHRLAATYVQWGETLQQRLGTPDHRAALIQELRKGVGAEIGRLESEGVQRRYKAETGRELWPLPEYRTLAGMLETLTEPQIAEGLGWAAGQHLRAVKTAIEHLSVAAADPTAPARLERLTRERQRFAQARREWMEPSTEELSRALEQFRVVPAPNFRQLEGSVVGFYVEGDGLRFARPLALAIAQAPAGRATLAGVVPTEADKAALVDSLAAVPAAQTLAVEGVVTLEQIPDARTAREEAFRRLHAHGATYSHMITAEHDEDPVAYLQQLLAQLGVTLPPDLEHPDQLDPTAHTAALTLLRAASSAGIEEDRLGSPSETRREFLGDLGRSIAALTRLSGQLGTLADLLAPPGAAPTVPRWDADRDVLREVARQLVFADDDPQYWVNLATARAVHIPSEFSGSERFPLYLKWGGMISIPAITGQLEEGYREGQSFLERMKTATGRAASLRDLRSRWSASEETARPEAARGVHIGRRFLKMCETMPESEVIEGLQWAVSERVLALQGATRQTRALAETLRELGTLVVPSSPAASLVPAEPRPRGALVQDSPAAAERRPSLQRFLRDLRARGMTITSAQAQVMLQAQAAGGHDVLLLERPSVDAGTTVTLYAPGELHALLTLKVSQWPAWPSAEAPVTFAVQALPAAGEPVAPHAVTVRLANQPRVEGMPNLVVHSLEELDRVTAELVATIAYAPLPPADQDLPVVAVLPLTLDGRDLLALFL